MTYFTEIGFKNANRGDNISWGKYGYYLLIDEKGEPANLPDDFNEKINEYSCNVIEEPILNKDSEGNIISCSKIGKISIYR